MSRAEANANGVWSRSAGRSDGFSRPAPALSARGDNETPAITEFFFFLSAETWEGGGGGALNKAVEMSRL